MTDDTRRAEELRILIAVQSSPTAQTETIFAALRAARDEGLQSAIEALQKADPLEAGCGWEDADDIAHAVRRYLVQRVESIRSLKSKGGE